MEVPGDSPDHGRDEATQRFYQNRRTSAPHLSVGDTMKSSTQDTAPQNSANASASLKSEMALVDSLEAFMNSNEEDAIGLLATFTQLTERDKLKVLGQLEEERESAAGSEQVQANEKTLGGNNTTGKDKPVANYAVLRRRLQERESEQRRVDQQRQRHKEKTKDIHRHVGVNTPATMRGASPSHNFLLLPYTSAEDVEVDELETVELEDGTHTGNLVAFFDKGVTNVSTSFDNFFGIPDEATLLKGNSKLSAASRETGKPAVAPDTVVRAQPVVMTLDEILSLDDAEQPSPSQDARQPPHASAFPSPTENAAGEKHEEARAARDNHLRWPRESALRVAASADAASSHSASSSSTSMPSSVSLPGLEEAEDAAAQDGVVVVVVGEHPSESAACKNLQSHAIDVRTSAVATDLLQVIAEHDDCVQTFALDPLFDYDADLFGEAFRNEKAWRQ